MHGGKSVYKVKSYEEKTQVCKPNNKPNSKPKPNREEIFSLLGLKSKKRKVKKHYRNFNKTSSTKSSSSFSSSSVSLLLLFCFLSLSLSFPLSFSPTGISFSNTNRRRDNNNNNHRRFLHHHHPPPPFYYLDPSPPPPPPPPPPPFPPHYDYNYSNYNISPPLPPQPQINSCSYGQCHYYPQPPQYFTTAQPNWWPQTMRPGFVGPPQPQPLPPPYVEQQNAKKVRNDVNVHRDTVRLEVDDLVPGHHLVSFVFDALFDGSFTITFFAKEEPNCTFIPQFPQVYASTRFHFQKGPGQKFLQPSGTGTDLSFFALDDLSKPLQEDVYPLVISAETLLSPNSISEQSSVHKQVTQAVLEKNNNGSFKVKVVKQILWIEGVRYELRELYGSTTQGAASGLEDSGSGKECVICMTEAKDTAVLPCRHLCMCSDCAKELRLQSNKCPICRQPIEELLEINVNSSDEQH